LHNIVAAERRITRERLEALVEESEEPETAPITADRLSALNAQNGHITNGAVAMDMETVTKMDATEAKVVKAESSGSVAGDLRKTTTMAMRKSPIEAQSRMTRYFYRCSSYFAVWFNLFIVCVLLSAKFVDSGHGTHTADAEDAMRGQGGDDK